MFISIVNHGLRITSLFWDIVETLAHKLSRNKKLPDLWSPPNATPHHPRCSITPGKRKISIEVHITCVFTMRIWLVKTRVKIISI